MKKEKEKEIAVVTACQSDFERYVRSQPKDMRSLFSKITTLRDINNYSYSKCVLIIESKNVTDFVINKVKDFSALVEDLSESKVY